METSHGNIAWKHQDSYPMYCRRSKEDGARIIVKSSDVHGNLWVVPYNPYLSLEYDAHINVEICVSVMESKKSVKMRNKRSLPDQSANATNKQKVLLAISYLKENKSPEID